MAVGRVNVSGGNKQELSRFRYSSDWGAFNGLDDKHNYYSKSLTTSDKKAIKVDSKTGVIVNEVPFTVALSTSTKFNHTGIYYDYKQYDLNGVVIRDLPNNNIYMIEDGVAVECAQNSGTVNIKILDEETFVEIETYSYTRLSTEIIDESYLVFPNRFFFAQIKTSTLMNYRGFYNTKKRTIFNNLDSIYNYSYIGFIANNYDEGVVQ